MPFNGAGLFVRVRNWMADAAAGIKIRADFHDSEDDNFMDGLSQCIVRDGQSTIVANIPFNSKRITTLADPVNAQDAATMAYADTKLPIAGGTITGSLTVNGNIAAGGEIWGRGYLCRAGLNGAYGGNWFNFNWDGSYLQVYADDYNVGALCTTARMEQRASDWAHYVADPKVNRAGDTMTGNLGVNGWISTASNVYYFNTTGYLQWQGGGTYVLGNSGTIWTTGNLAPVTNARWVDAGQRGPLGTGWQDWGNMYGISAIYRENSAYFPITYVRLHYLQILVPSGWVTVG